MTDEIRNERLAPLAGQASRLSASPFRLACVWFSYMLRAEFVEFCRIVS